MPELPEVEITRRRIAPLLVGRRISGVTTTRDSYLYLTPPARLRRGLEGRQVTDLARRGKYLVATLDDAQRLLIHLGMTGQLFAETATSVRLLSATARQALAPEEQVRFAPDAHTHLQVAFDDGQEIADLAGTGPVTGQPAEPRPIVQAHRAHPPRTPWVL